MLISASANVTEICVSPNRARGQIQRIFSTTCLPAHDVMQLARPNLCRPNRPEGTRARYGTRRN